MPLFVLLYLSALIYLFFTIALPLSLFYRLIHFFLLQKSVFKDYKTLQEKNDLDLRKSRVGKDSKLLKQYKKSSICASFASTQLVI